MDFNLKSGTSMSVLALGAAGLFYVGATPALAQVEDIFVYARKTEENLQQVPISVTAFSGDTFQQAGLTQFSDIAKLTPNFDVRPRGTTGALFANLTIRGQTTGFLTINTDQAVGININGAPITRGTSLFTNLFDIERIEVLKGPQGTLFGKNTTGGAVVVVTKAPELDEFGGYGQITVGSFNRTDGQLVANFPIIKDQLAVRLGVARTHRDGFGQGGQGDSVLTGVELADDNELFLRGSVLYEPNNSLSVRVNADYHDVDESTSIGRVLRGVAFGPTVIAVQSTNPDIYVGNNFGDEAPRAVSEEFNINATIEYDFGAAILTSITSYREQDSETLLQETPFTPVFPGQDSNLFAQEVRLSGEALDDRLTWQGGIFYAKESGDDFDRLPGIGADSSTSAENRTFSIFTQNTFRVTDDLGLTAGIRYTDERREVTSLVDLPGLEENEASFDGVSWLVSLDYQTTEDTLIYASVSRGFRSGAIDQDDIETVVNPEFVISYEIGQKSDLFDDRLRFNTAFYYSDYKDIQITAFDPESFIPVTRLRNAASATLWGFEAELTAQPTDGLTVGATVGYTNAEFNEFIDQTNAGEPLDRTQDPIGGPAWQFSVNARYEREVASGTTLGAQANFFWISEETVANPRIAAAFNPGEDVLPAFGILNGQIDLKMEALGGLNIALFGTNILDKEYFNGAATQQFSPTQGIANRVVGQPREWGIRMTKDF